MKKSRIILCAAALALICALTLSFLSLFTRDSSPLLGHVAWSSAEIVEPGGASRPFDPYGVPPEDWQEGAVFHITGRLPELDELPALYEDPGYVVLDGMGLELTALIGGVECARIRYPDRGQRMDACQFHLPLTADDAGKELELRYTPLDPESAQYPLFARYSSESANYRFSYATASRAALPAGAYILCFILICAVFLISVCTGRPDWSLLLLAPVAFTAAALRLNALAGCYFLPRRLYDLLLQNWVYLLLIALLLLYLFLNRKEHFWRYLGQMTLFTAAAVAVWYGLDSLGRGFFASSINLAFQHLFLGDPSDLLRYLGIYLTTACGCIAAYSLARRTLAVRSRAAALSQRNHLITESYETIRRSLESTALMRHEWKNQIAALQVLAKRGDLDALNRSLDELDGRLAELSPRVYCGHFAINILLQNAAARAERLGVRFSATALVPPELPIEEGDLCSLLLNLLDNALEAASHSPEGKRSVSLGIRVNQGYLTVRCENSYRGPLSLDGEGELRTTKPDRGGHGLGLLQVRAVAEKYRGMFDVQYTPELFTAAASLKLPD